MAENENGNAALLASRLFMELASESRFSILVSLDKKPAKLSALARELDSTVQEVHRNLNRLLKEGLLRRNDGVFYLTDYGKMVISQVPYFSFLRKHRNFFQSHNINESGIPAKFLQRVGALEHCKIVESVTAVLQRLKKLESSADLTLKVMVSQAWPEEGEIFIERAGAGVEVQVIVGQNTIIPKNVAEQVGPAIQKLILQGMFKQRMIDKVTFSLYIADEKQAGLMFPSAGGDVDMNHLFVGEDQRFCEWCSDLFSYTWQNSKAFDTKKLKIVE